MHTKQRLLTLAAALSISLTACDGLPTEPTLGLETGEVALSLHDPTTVVIDFENVLDPPPDQFATYPEHHEDGFTLSNTTGFLLVQEGDFFYSGFSTTVIPSEDVTELTKDDEGAFDVASIDIIKELFFDELTTIEFTGIKADGSRPVEETFSTDGSLGLETLTFSGFTNLRLLSWVRTGGPAHIDNITFGSSDPVTRADCMKGGWEDFGFRNQGQCVRFVEKNENGKDKR